ncbi:hypothetical protein AK812_SmicGene4778 [Symbiodinium microadriaticum]|uniref:Uncharacterized protein n=1 Tax=Symbiodinium microadriaticum TaxID=2951 RepID=A0A1Q9EVJ4_SYMMI|nr:hypothetical protein AK812_SmicGene4778 [Symbiodinium microadriaticum]
MRKRRPCRAAFTYPSPSIMRCQGLRGASASAEEVSVSADSDTEIHISLEASPDSAGGQDTLSFFSACELEGGAGDEESGARGAWGPAQSDIPDKKVGESTGEEKISTIKLASYSSDSTLTSLGLPLKLP